MRLLKTAIVALASEGRVTLQVPDLVLRFEGDPDPEYGDFPDNWFVRTTPASKDRTVLVVGKEQGFLYLSHAGWVANREAMADAYVAYITNHGGPRLVDAPTSREEYKRAMFAKVEGIYTSTMQRREEIMTAAKKKCDALFEACQNFVNPKFS